MATGETRRNEALVQLGCGSESIVERYYRLHAPVYVTGGRVAVVDFHDSNWPWFQRRAEFDNVRVNGQVRPLLLERFAPLHDEVRSAYGGIWRHLLFLGQRQRDLRTT